MKACFIFYCFLFLLLTCKLPVVAQDVRFSQLLPPEGEDFDHVTGITQDKLGIVWLSTKRGLYRYDGYTMQLYRNNSPNSFSLVNNLLETVYADKEGNIWVGTLGSGLALFNSVTTGFTHFRHDPKLPGSLVNDTVTSILQDREGMLWIGTHGGLEQFNPKTKVFTHYRSVTKDAASLSSNQVRSIYEDRQGTIWIGTGSPYPDNGSSAAEGGLNRLNKKTGRFTRYLHDDKHPNSLLNNKVRAICEDSRGNFWIGTGGNALHLMNRATGSFQRLVYNPTHPNGPSAPPMQKKDATWDHVSFIHEDAAGGLWIGTVESGVNYFNPATGKQLHYDLGKDSTNELSENSPWCAYSSNDGTLWISTMAGELYRVDPFQQTIPFHSIGANIFAGAFLEEDDGSFWIGTGRGILYQDANGNGRKQFFSDPKNPVTLSSNEIINIKKDRRANVWVSTPNGLNLWNKEKQLFVRYQHDERNNTSISSNLVVPVYEDRQSNLWVGTGKGLDLFNRAEGTFTHYTLNNPDTLDMGRNAVTAITQDVQSRLWVGLWQGSGVYLFTPSKGFYKQYLKGGSISGLYVDATGELWAGSNYGLYRYNPWVDSFFRFEDASSMKGIDNVVSLAEDNDRNFWIGTLNGIVRLNAERTETAYYGKSYGVKENSLVYLGAYKTKSGTIYIGATNGYFSFSPKELRKNLRLPAISLSAFRLADRLILPLKESPLKEPLSDVREIHLSHNQNVFSFDFAVIDFTDPAANRHLFMLENYDVQWRQAGSDRRAYYFNVPPGKYVFRVKGANSKGVWAERQVVIVISPPWWQTWWANTLLALVVALTAYRVYRIQRRRLLRAEREKARRKALAQAKEIEKAYTELKDTQAQLIQKEKMASLGELTAGIAHEIRNPLNFINNFSEVNLELTEELKAELQASSLLAETKEALSSLLDDLQQNNQKIAHHGKRADAIVNSMLQHSRSSTGQKEPTDINALADENLRLSYHGLRAKDRSFQANFTTHFDESIGSINVVPQDIGRVLLNFYNNAFYSVNEKKKQLNGVFEPTVFVSTKKAGSKIQISVKDNGNGIPQKVLDKIFQPFFTTKPTGQGTGLGLSLSYDIVKAHGGELKVETTEGQGSTFIMSIPIID